MAAYIDSISN